MKVGDLILWSGTRWLVKSIERETKSALLASAEARGVEVVASDLDVTDPKECQVLGNPSTDWPFVVVRPKQALGRLLSLARPNRQRQEVLLQPLADWVIPDARQIGGALFLNHALRLRVGEVLVAAYEKGRMNITIPHNFGTTQERVAWATPPPEPDLPTSYDRLLGGDFDEEDKG